VKPEIDYTLYLVTDRGLMAGGTIEECVEQAILGGCTMVQLREKKRVIARILRNRCEGAGNYGAFECAFDYQ